MNRNRKKIPLGDLIFQIINFTILTLFTFACVFPFWYVFIYSVSDPVLAQGGLTILPVGFTLSSYKQVFALPNIGNSLLISLLRTVIGTVVTVLTCSLFAYLIVQKDLPFRKLIYRFVIVTMYLSPGLIPTYLTLRTLGFRNNFLVYIIPCALSAYNVILIKTFIEQLPAALEESAKIDGAGFWVLYARIMLPLSLPILATIAIFAAVGQWNSWMDTMFYITDRNLYTAQYVLYTYLNQAELLAEQMKNMQTATSAATTAITPTAIKMTITMIIVFPILLVYPFMQRFFVKGLMLGAVKG